MQRIDVTADMRLKSGKGAARQTRRAGRIPAVLYSAGASELLTLDPRQIIRLLRHGGHGQNALIHLTITNAPGPGPGNIRPTRTAILRDFQADPVDGTLLHADLFEIALDRPIRLKVPLERVGEQPVGVKDGGVLQHHMREVEVEGLPETIPDTIPVDASRLTIGQAIHVKDLASPQGVTVLSPAHLQVLAVIAPISEAKLEQLLTATPTAEAKEPEVLRERKKPEEGAEGAPGTADKAEKGEGGKKAAAKPEGKAPEAKAPDAKVSAKGKKEDVKRGEKEKKPTT